MAADSAAVRPARHRPRTTTVFVAAFVAGAAAAVGVNRALDVRLAQAKPQVECEPIFVALRDLPAGAPVTVWDVALRDLPKAMVPATALRVSDSFAGRLLKFPLRAGQPLIAAQLLQPEVAAPAVPETPSTEQAAQETLVEEAFVPPVPATPVAAEATAPATDSAIDPSETAASRPAADEPAGTLASPSTAQTVAATETGDGDEGEPVASVSEVTGTVGSVGDEVTEVTTGTDTTAGTPESVDLDPQAPVVAVTEPTPAAEPVEPTPASAPPVEFAPSVSLASDLFADDAGRFDAEFDATLDMPSRPTANLADLPSVMTSSDTASAAQTASGAGSGVRYLVVPERIARQVDTSFTTPAAPEAATAAPAQAAARVDGGPTARPAAPTTLPPTSVTKPQPRQPGRQPATPPRQGATKQQARPQPAKKAVSPGPTARPGQPTAAVPQPTGPRAWGGMFPNVAAGLEAMGSWRTGSRAAPAQSERGSTTR